MPEPAPRSCPMCGQVFTPGPHAYTALFCGVECRREAQRRRFARWYGQNRDHHLGRVKARDSKTRRKR